MRGVYLHRNPESNASVSKHKNLYDIGVVTVSTDLGKLYKLGFLSKKRQERKVYLLHIKSWETEERELRLATKGSAAPPLF